MEFKSFVYTLNELWKDELLCDITLVSGDQHIKAHKIILSGVSEYFKYYYSNYYLLKIDLGLFSLNT